MVSRSSASGKAAVIVLGIFTLLAIAGAGAAVFLQMQERALRLVREKELRVVKAENTTLQEQLTEVTSAKVQLEGELTQARADLDQLAQQLADEQHAKDELAKAVEGRQQEIDRLSKDLEQVRTERTQLTQRIAQLTERQKSLEVELNQIETAKAELEDKVVELSQDQPTVELEKVVVTDGGVGGSSASSGGTAGQVVVVNREYDFVVMNLGKNHGLSLGQEFQVIRDNQILGRVKVEKIYDELSAAAILPQSKKESIREGDSVRAAL
ncbi:MAG: hypothetical protein HY595_00085 [Candidatus Omnitrophica bacterium]|nr:hypothetical protein [Candidatus Omnitrophota bacterium]